MNEFRVFYWTDSKYVNGLVPTEKDFRRDYRELPAPSRNLKPIVTGQDALNQLYAEYNDYKNPMGTAEMQNWIRDNLLPNRHTSMSIGDIIELDGELWLCRVIGWEKLPFKAQESGQEPEDPDRLGGEHDRFEEDRRE